MKPIGEVIKPLEKEILKGRTPPTSSIDDGGATGGGPGSPNEGGPNSGGDDRDPCPRCGGLRWLGRDVPVEHPDFGKAFPCDCMADELASRRLVGLQQLTHIANLSELTFDRFLVDAPGNSPDQIRSLRSAFEAARDFAEQPAGWLVLHGGFGCGKTHLAAAIVNQQLKQGGTALFVVVPDLLDHLRASYAPDTEESYDVRFESVRESPLLVLDDLGTQATTPWAAEKLFQILNHRYNARLATVITTNSDIEELDDRLRSRLGHFGLVRPIEMKALDYRGGVMREGAELSSLQLHSDATFGNWDARLGELDAELAANLARGFDLARRFAEEPQGWLVITGQYGCGKTHLAASIANHRVAMGGAPLFVVVPDLLDHLRATFSPTSRVPYDKRFEEIRSAELLVLDDLGTESATPWAREKLYQILNHRYAARLPTVVTTASSIKDLHPRLRTRMLDRRRCRVFELLTPPYYGAAPQGGPKSHGKRSRGRR